MEINKKLIPKGEYCYSEKGGGKLDKCPYWELKSSINGYCGYIEKSDEDFSYTTLLYEYIKTCEINM